jgi:hypothetical protein
MQGGVEAAKPVINNRINLRYCGLVVHYFQNLFLNRQSHWYQVAKIIKDG